jgi:hypothetical protein
MPRASAEIWLVSPAYAVKVIELRAPMMANDASTTSFRNTVCV